MPEFLGATEGVVIGAVGSSSNSKFTSVSTIDMACVWSFGLTAVTSNVYLFLLCSIWMWSFNVSAL
jgi:hypothetical protein